MSLHSPSKHIVCPFSWPSSLTLPENVWLVDCGEGTQHRLLDANLGSQKNLNHIFITHLHGDHVYGLPGLLCHLAIIPDMKPIRIFGPPGIQQLVSTILNKTSNLPWNLQFTELALDYSDKGFDTPYHKLWSKSKNIFCDNILLKSSGTTMYTRSYFLLLCKRYEDEDYEISAVPILHSIPCLGYVFREKDIKGKLLPEKIQEETGITDRRLYKRIKAGDSSVLPEGFKCSDFITKDRTGRKIVILGDTFDPSLIIPKGENCDVLVHESTFLKERDEAIYKGHSTAGMAADVASRMKAKSLILTHFSIKYTHELDMLNMMKEARKKYKGILVAAHDFLNVDVRIQKRDHAE